MEWNWFLSATPNRPHSQGRYIQRKKLLFLDWPMGVPGGKCGYVSTENKWMGGKILVSLHIRQELVGRGIWDTAKATARAQGRWALELLSFLESERERRRDPVLLSSCNTLVCGILIFLICSLIPLFWDCTLEVRLGSLPICNLEIMENQSISSNIAKFVWRTAFLRALCLFTSMGMLFYWRFSSLLVFYADLRSFHSLISRQRYLPKFSYLPHCRHLVHLLYLPAREILMSSFLIWSVDYIDIQFMRGHQELHDDHPVGLTNLLLVDFLLYLKFFSPSITWAMPDFCMFTSSNLKRVVCHLKHLHHFNLTTMTTAFYEKISSSPPSSIPNFIYLNRC